MLEHGQLVQLGTPREIYENPISSYVASRLGSPRINLVLRSALGHALAPPQDVTVGLRAEHLALVPDGAAPATGAPARVVRLEHLSDQRLALITLNGTDQEIVAHLPAEATWQPGDQVRMQWRQPLWFDARGQRIPA